MSTYHWKFADFFFRIGFLNYKLEIDLYLSLQAAVSGVLCAVPLRFHFSQGWQNTFFQVAKYRKSGTERIPERIIQN